MEQTADLDLVPIPETSGEVAWLPSDGSAEEGGWRGSDATRPVEDAFFPDRGHEILTAEVKGPAGGTELVLHVAPGEAVILPFGPDAALQAALGHGNLAIKAGDLVVILEGYVAASGARPPVIESSDGHPLDIAAILAATDPGINIATAAGPDAGAQHADNTGAILQAFGTAAGLGGFASVGGQDNSTGPNGFSGADASGGSVRPTNPDSPGSAPDAGGSAPVNDHGPNTPPVVGDLALVTDEDTKLQGHLSATDANGDPVTFHLVGPVPDGVTLAADGSFSFDPRLQYDFLDGAADAKPAQQTSLTFQYAANDGQEDSNTGTVTIKIGGENDRAIISGDTSSDYFLGTTHGLVGVLDVWDADRDGALMLPDSGHTNWGAWSVDVRGEWEYTVDNPDLATILPNPDGSLTDHFTVTSLDGSKQDITVTIHGHDEAPKILGETGIRGLTEEDSMTVHLSDFVRISDPDSSKFSFHAVNAPSGLSLAADGTVEIDLKGNYDSLREGETKILDLTYTVSDGYLPSNVATYQVYVTGVNDPASFSGDTNGACLVSNGSPAGGILDVFDLDAGEAHTKASAGTANYGSWSIDANGRWVYDVDSNNAAVKALAHGETLTDQFTVASADLSATQTVTVTLYGHDEPPQISTTLTGIKLTEDETTTIHLPDFNTIVDPDSTVFSYELYSSAPGLSLAPDGTLQFDAAGHYDALKAGESETFDVLYEVRDGAPGDPLTTIGKSIAIPIEIVGVNDVATITGKTSASFELGNLFVKVSGGVNVNDADKGEAHPLVQSGDSSFGHWSVDPDGFWDYTPDTKNAAVKALGNGETLTDHFTVTSLDGSASQVITITLEGHDIAPKIASTLGDVAMTEESVKTLFLPDHVKISDPDSTVFTYALSNPPAGVTVTKDGTLTIDAVNDFDSAPAGQTQTVDIVFGVNDGHHLSNLQTITVEITGVNDPASITGATEGFTTVGEATAIGANIRVHDADFGEDQPLADSGKATYGSWSVSANGVWIYRPDLNNAALKALGADETLTDQFTVTSIDHTATQAVTITIHGQGYVAPAAAADLIFARDADATSIFHDAVAVRSIESPSRLQSLAFDAETVKSVSDHTITPDALFGEHAAISIDTGTVDQLYLSISKTAGSWTDTELVLGEQEVYAHETQAGHAESTDAYVMVDTAARASVQVNHDIP